LILEDPTGSTQVILFPDVFNLYSPLLKGDEPLLIRGTAEVDGMSAKIIAQEVNSLENVRQKSMKAIELNLRAETMSREFLEEIRDIIFRYPGECPVLFRVDTGQGKGVIIEAHDRFKVSPCDEMMGEIEMMIGEKVVSKYGEEDSNRRQPESP
jgi:DNA polymerase-3 subunit alpha